MVRYDSLTKKLEENGSGRLTMSFAEIVECMGELPGAAHKYEAWWANEPHHTQAQAWLAAGYEVERVDLNTEMVTYRRSNE